jgi:hypothetical protein
MIRTETKTKIVHADLSYILTGLCFKVQNRISRFGREKQYCDEFEQLLKETGINYRREALVDSVNPNSPAGNRVDFLIENLLIWN